MNKIIRRVIIVLICLIPAAIATLIYINSQKLPVETSDITSLKWETPGRVETEYLMSDKEGAKFITFLLKMNQNALQVDQLPKDCNRQMESGQHATLRILR